MPGHSSPKLSKDAGWKLHNTKFHLLGTHTGHRAWIKFPPQCITPTNAVPITFTEHADDSFCWDCFSKIKVAADRSKLFVLGCRRLSKQAFWYVTAGKALRIPLTTELTLSEVVYRVLVYCWDTSWSWDLTKLDPPLCFLCREMSALKTACSGKLATFIAWWRLKLTTRPEVRETLSYWIHHNSFC